MAELNDRTMLRWAAAGAPMAIAPLVLSVMAFTDAEPAPSKRFPERDPVLALQGRAVVLQRGLSLVDQFYEGEVAPIVGMLSPFHQDQAWVRQVAFALVREGRQTDIDPRVLAAVVMVENPWLSTTIESSAGAVGIMQVMPLHAGKWGCGSGDLTDLQVNVCHGARIFQWYMERHDGNVDRALLAYNGCVNGTNTPDCHLYPSHVYSRAGRAAVQWWLTQPRAEAVPGLGSARPIGH